MATKLIKKKERWTWLITWEASSEQRLKDVQGPRIIAFLDGRKSFGTVKDIILGIYFSSFALNHEEKLDWALSNHAKKTLRKHYDPTYLKVGLTPWIEARQVEGVHVKRFSSTEYLITWKQQIFKLVNGEYKFSGMEDREEKVLRPVYDFAKPVTKHAANRSG